MKHCFTINIIVLRYMLPNFPNCNCNSYTLAEWSLLKLLLKIVRPYSMLHQTFIESQVSRLLSGVRRPVFLIYLKSSSALPQKVCTLLYCQICSLWPNFKKIKLFGGFALKKICALIYYQIRPWSQF